MNSCSEGDLTQARHAESEAVRSLKIRCREFQMRSVSRWGVLPPGTRSWSGRVEGAVAGSSRDGAFSTEHRAVGKRRGVREVFF